MKRIKYKGTSPIKFYSNEVRQIVKPNDTIPISDELYEKEYKNNTKWELVGGNDLKEVKKAEGLKSLDNYDNKKLELKNNKKK